LQLLALQYNEAKPASIFAPTRPTITRPERKTFMKSKLNDMCDYYGICLNHHRADSDSHACAEILIRYMKDGADPTKYIRTYRMT